MASKKTTKTTAAPVMAVYAGPTRLKDVPKWLEAHGGPQKAAPQLLAAVPKMKTELKAAAVRALATIGTDAALDVMVGYRPRFNKEGVVHEGSGNDTFGRALAEELLAAWERFDRRIFAQRMFSGLKELWIKDAGDIADIEGIDAAEDLDRLVLAVGPTCDLTPLERCAALSWLELALDDRPQGFEPLTRIPRLERLKIYSEGVGQAAIDALAGAHTVEGLTITVKADTDLSPLARMKGLKNLWLDSDERNADPPTVAAVRELLEHGVVISFYTHQEWPVSLAKKLKGFASDIGPSYVCLGRDAREMKLMLTSLGW